MGSEPIGRLILPIPLPGNTIHAPLMQPENAVNKLVIKKHPQSGVLHSKNCLHNMSAIFERIAVIAPAMQPPVTKSVASNPVAARIANTINPIAQPERAEQRDAFAFESIGVPLSKPIINPTIPGPAPNKQLPIGLKKYPDESLRNNGELDVYP